MRKISASNYNPTIEVDVTFSQYKKINKALGLDWREVLAAEDNYECALGRLPDKFYKGIVKLACKAADEILRKKREERKR